MSKKTDQRPSTLKKKSYKSIYLEGEGQRERIFKQTPRLAWSVTWGSIS